MADREPPGDARRERAAGAIVPITQQDLPAIAEYLSSPEDSFGAGGWLARFEHWWDRNPYFEEGAARGFVVRDGERICGFYGVFPLPFQLGGAETRVYAGTTWRVAPSYGRHALTLLTRVMKTATGSLFFTWTESEGVIKTLKALRFAEIPRPPAIRASAPNTLLLRTDRLPSRVLRWAGPAVRLHAETVRFAMGLRARSLRARRLHQAVAGIDELWRRTRSCAPTTQVRDQRFVQWHCFQGTVFPKRVYAAYRGDSIVGILVGCESFPRSMRILDVADVWTDAAEPAAADALLAEAIADVRGDGFDAVVLPAWSDALVRLGKRRAFLPRRVTFYPEFVHGPKEMVDTFLATSGRLNAFIGDRYL